MRSWGLSAIVLSLLSVARCLTVAARIGTCDERIADREDRLADAERVHVLVEYRLVTECPQLVGVLPEPRLERDLASFQNAEAPAVERALRVGAVDQVRDELEMRLRLHRPAHDPEGAEQLAVLEQHSRDDRVERPLAGRDAVGMLRIGREAERAVLQHDARVAS